MTVESTAATAEQQEQESNPKYRMTVSLNVLNHLGIGLYSNIPAVLSELVANAWDALAKCLRTRFPEEPAHIEMIAILGSPPGPGSDQENRDLLASIHARYITYDQLVLEAERSYKEYLEKDKEISELIEIVDGLDEDFAPQAVGG